MEDNTKYSTFGASAIAASMILQKIIQGRSEKVMEEPKKFSSKIEDAILEVTRNIRKELNKFKDLASEAEHRIIAERILGMVVTFQANINFDLGQMCGVIQKQIDLEEKEEEQEKDV